ncbi:19021_t:CDS:1 [Dentiscutata erythropus]|uniref:19021_t:CDS:1 n=1 Tax=Dentiscutata erythropus TaxID=1348616 RepID=A0A9N9JDP4_9GLOM|nr:19021_t:CDS:1 [Dentiscutata erythropus]
MEIILKEIEIEKLKEKALISTIHREFYKNYYLYVPYDKETGKATISVNSFTEEEIITNKEKKMFEKLLNDITNDFGGEILLQKYIYLQQIKLKIDSSSCKNDLFKYIDNLYSVYILANLNFINE